MADANVHYNAANSFAEQAHQAATSGNAESFDSLIDLAVLQARLGHLSLAISRRHDYIRHGTAQTRNGGSSRRPDEKTNVKE